MVWGPHVMVSDCPLHEQFSFDSIQTDGRYELRRIIMNTNHGKLFGKDFTLVVIGQIISLFGNAILRFALPLYLLRETGSSALFGTVTAFSFIPMIVMSLMGGVLADRVNKRNIMVALDFSTAALIGLYALFLGRSPLVPGLIVFLMLLYGISGTYQPAVQASIPVLLGERQLMRGNAIINMISTLSGLLGPVVGGILFGTWGIGPILAVSLICFTISAVMEIFIRIPHQKQKTESRVLATVRNDLAESMRFIRQERPAYLSVMFVLAMFNLILSAAMIVGIPVVVVNVLKQTDEALGVTQGALGLGGLAGGCLAGILGPKMKLRHGHILLIACAGTVFVTGMALLPGLSPVIAYWVITGMSFAAMAASTLFVVQLCTAVQQQTPPHLLGKVMAVILAVSNCSQPLGQALYGILFEAAADHCWIVWIGASAAALLISLYSKKAFVNLELGMDAEAGLTASE